MRAVVQRVVSASVTVDGLVVGEIGPGLLIYLGAARADEASDLTYVANKVAGLRIFPADDGRMTRDVLEHGGEALVVSQFTLFGDVRRGKRPSFTEAELPEQAEILYERFLTELRNRGLRVANGRFRADMRVHSVVDGPVTILVDSRRAF